MTEEKIYEVSNSIKENALLAEDEYKKLYKESIENPEEFWSKQARWYND